MNKLTEIKANYEKFKDEIVERRLPITELTKMLLDDMGHLISLLEEKDKALNDICMRTDEGSWVNHRASYALNTSSKEESQ